MTEPKRKETVLDHRMDTVCEPRGAELSSIIAARAGEGCLRISAFGLLSVFGLRVSLLHS